MRERPILFSAPMVRAILAGTKTQTRRVVKPQPEASSAGHLQGAWLRRPLAGLLLPKVEDIALHCPYGQPGDRLWVRESGWERPIRSARDLREGADTWPPYEFDAEPVCCWEDGELKRLGWKRRPSIHMPRWASRITLEITSVRVERLQDISIEDAKAEGAWGPDESIVDRVAEYFGTDLFAANPRRAFQMLWEQINGTESWAANPWVWRITFRRVES